MAVFSLRPKQTVDGPHDLALQRLRNITRTLAGNRGHRLGSFSKQKRWLNGMPMSQAACTNPGCGAFAQVLVGSNPGGTALTEGCPHDRRAA